MPASGFAKAMALVAELEKQLTTLQAQHERVRSTKVVRELVPNELLEQCVLGALGYVYESTPRDVHRNVLDTYGTVSERQVYRVLARLVKQGRAFHGFTGYRRSDSP